MFWRFLTSALFVQAETEGRSTLLTKQSVGCRSASGSQMLIGRTDGLVFLVAGTVKRERVPHSDLQDRCFLTCRVKFLLIGAGDLASLPHLEESSNGLVCSSWHMLMWHTFMCVKGGRQHQCSGQHVHH